MAKPSHKLRFCITSPHPCNYLTGREASNVFVDPYFPKDKQLYAKLLASGFRRSGEHLYKPHCMACSECISVRIPVNEFKMRRHQKRAWRRNQDLNIKQCKAVFKEEHFQLYSRYQAARHPDGGMDNANRDNYIEFILATWSDTYLYEFRLMDKLICVSVVDELEDACSAVYTFFDTEYAERSLGKFAILTLIEQSKQRGYSSLYLGYWIADCGKMKYKIEYQPIECLVGEDWKKFNTLSFNDFAVKQN